MALAHILAAFRDWRASIYDDQNSGLRSLTLPILSFIWEVLFILD